MGRLPVLRRTFDAWGTTITVDVVDHRSAPEDQKNVEVLDATMPTVREVAAHIDAVFSPWRDDSLTSAMRRGEVCESDLYTLGVDGAWMLRVLLECRRAESITCGAFNPWKAPGGFDPSGYVKGWGAALMADTLVAAGLPDVCVDAAGDLATRGAGPDGGAWHVGITHPGRTRVVCAVVDSGPSADIEGVAGAVATSGSSQREGHVSGRDSRRTRASQATVVGPDAALADALATGLLIDGVDSVEWFDEFAREDLRIGRSHSRWGALVVQDGRLFRLGRLATTVPAAT
ncbi:FAD:protein FMN transferase [Schaalia sp. 19OD2882]|uniref:FAD:protein FMN transferase n=1 Tax=Schaalia sp. 19OD2882 TaxID=2794089 RepID=UPI001C1F10B5|nr:FAD:protein FMN transferase [Schaalia sp. 19OD2882]QWW18673.1 FAD:protein FMN transferase [Schaalia sp. 19OD2882]